jgi:hypothetical protein
MGLRDKVVELLSRGTPPELDPDELVHVEEVPLAANQITVEALRREGIEAVTAEIFNPAIGAQARADILVPRRQHAEATTYLDSLR